MGWGMATGRAQKILKLGDYQGWLVPEGSWAPAWRAGGAGVTQAPASRGQRFPRLFHHASDSAQGSDVGEFAGPLSTWFHSNENHVKGLEHTLPHSHWGLPSKVETPQKEAWSGRLPRRPPQDQPGCAFAIFVL